MDIKKDNPEQIAVIALFAFALICTFVGRAFTAIYPEYSDAMLFTYIGEQWTHGSIPYLDIWDNKPPGIFALVAAVFSLFPRSFIALSIVEGAFIMGCILSVYALMRELRAPWASASLATACVAVMSNLLFYNERGLLTEIYTLFPMSMSMLFFIKGIKKLDISWMMVAGISSGLASIFNPKGLSPFISQMVFIFVLFTTQKVRLMDLGRMSVANAGGVMLAWIPCIAYFYLHNAAGSMLDAAFIFNVEYGSQSQPSLLTVPFNVAEMLQPVGSLFVAALLGGIFYLMMIRRSGIHTLWYTNKEITPYCFWTLVLLWVCVDFAGVLAGGRNYSHYYLALAPSLSVAAGFSYWQILHSTHEAPPAKVIKQFVFLLVVIPLLFPLAADAQKLRKMLSNGAPTDYWVPVTKYLKTIQQDGDTLFTWDYLPALYFQTNMGRVTKYLDNRFADLRKSIGNEVLDAIVQNKPTYIIERSRVYGKPFEDEDIYSRYKAFLADKYVLTYAANSVRIYVLQPRKER